MSRARTSSPERRPADSSRSPSRLRPGSAPSCAEARAAAAAPPGLPAAAYVAASTAAAVVLLAAADGGYFPSTWRWGSLGFAALAGLAVVAFGRPAPARAAWAFLAAVAAVGGWAALSALWSLDASASTLEAQRALLYVTAVAAFVALSRAGSGHGLVAGIVLGAAVVCLWALLDRGLTAPRLDPYEGHLLVGRIGYANGLAALAAVGAVPAAVVLLRRPARTTAAAAAAVLAVLVPALVLTNSRGGWVAGAAGAAFGGLLAFGRRREAAALLALAFVALALLLALPLHRGLGDRTAYWRAARDAVAARPALGSGSGTFARIWADAAPTGPPARDAHSLYLETLAEVGAPGLLLLLGLLALPLAAGLRAPRPPAAALGGYAVFCLHAGVDWDWELPAVTVAALALGVAALAASNPEPD